ncbi:hypothetical protein MRB53_022464 [Persea americana]|uniref:Uncharacterized protein n=1 Tax=Persea americana TaxID=3435 RepID=A0ACC2L6I6_PERAE|nr:hypothetical protein MRB53_022464 [Persea americana]
MLLSKHLTLNECAYGSSSTKFCFCNADNREWRSPLKLNRVIIMGPSIMFY